MIVNSGTKLWLIWLFFTCIFNQSSCLAASTKDTAAPRYMKIPILYMTDRAMSNTGYLNQRKYEDGSIYNVYCGSLNYIVENTQNKTLTEPRERYGWQTVDKAPKKSPLTIKSLADSGQNTAYKSFSQAIIEAAKNTGSQEVFIYIHGFNNPFSGAAHSAAKMAYYTERPVILYSWPSAGKILQYSVDGGNNEWSQEHFNRFLEELVLVKQQTGLKFNLVGHSMGNRLAIRAAPIIKGQRLFDQVFLIDPDFDAETFVHYVARFVATHTNTTIPEAVSDQNKMIADSRQYYSGKLRVLFSRRDNALPIVQFMFGGYTRLGQGADTLLESLFNPATLPDAIQSTTSLFQSTYQQSISNVPNIDQFDAQERAIINAFEWIDYTTLDHGLLGHSVPFQLVADLWSTGKPNDKLELIVSKNDNVNRFTRMASSFFHQGQHIGSFTSCEKVIFKPLYNGQKSTNSRQPQLQHQVTLAQ